MRILVALNLFVITNESPEIRREISMIRHKYTQTSCMKYFYPCAEVCKHGDKPNVIDFDKNGRCKSLNYTSIIKNLEFSLASLYR